MSRGTRRDNFIYAPPVTALFAGLANLNARIASPAWRAFICAVTTSSAEALGFGRRMSADAASRKPPSSDHRRVAGVTRGRDGANAVVCDIIAIIASASAQLWLCEPIFQEAVLSH